ncbi:hypothetical protein ACQ4PT_066667 [Festuca glaucescens]
MKVVVLLLLDLLSEEEECACFDDPEEGFLSATSIASSTTLPSEAALSSAKPPRSVQTGGLVMHMEQERQNVVLIILSMSAIKLVPGVSAYIAAKKSKVPLQLKLFGSDITFQLVDLKPGTDVNITGPVGKELLMCKDPNATKPGVVIALLDKACMFLKSTHETFAQKLYQNFLKHKR